MNNSPLILGIETSCDETAVALLQHGKVLANVISTQEIHAKHGGVIPEIASRQHQQNIVSTFYQALKIANKTKSELSAIAVTQGPGLMGALHVGVSFAKSLAWSLDIPIMGVNHLQAHVSALFLDVKQPKFPFLCLLVSGGHSQILLVNDFMDIKLIGKTIDDAAGEAFDKGAKLLGLPYPGGPLIDKYALLGNKEFHQFPVSNKIPKYDFTFSGLKTSLLYYIRDHSKDYITTHFNDICASYQNAIITHLMQKLLKASKHLGVKNLAIAGGVSANNKLRNDIKEASKKLGGEAYIPSFEYCTDNAAMIAQAGIMQYNNNNFGDISMVPFARNISNQY